MAGKGKNRTPAATVRTGLPGVMRGRDRGRRPAYPRKTGSPSRGLSQTRVRGPAKHARGRGWRTLWYRVGHLISSAVLLCRFGPGSKSVRRAEQCGHGLIKSKAIGIVVE